MVLRHWIVALLLLLFVAVLRAEPVSLGELARHPASQDAKISPDGKYLAATAVVEGHNALVLLPVADMKAGRVIRPNKNDDVTDFWWASSTRVVFTTGKSSGGYDAPLDSGLLLAIDADGGNTKVLGSARFIATIPNDPDEILVASLKAGTVRDDAANKLAYYQPWLVSRMDVHSGNMVSITTAPGNISEFIADHQGRVRYAIGEDANGKKRVFKHLPGSNGWNEMQKAEQDQSYPLAFNNDDSVVYFSCPTAGGGFAVCSSDPMDVSRETVWSNPTISATGLLRGMAGDIIGVDFVDGRPGAALFDSNSADAKTLVMLMRQFPGESVRFISGTRDGQRSIVYVYADADPGTFYLYDHQANKLTSLLPCAPWIDPTQMAGKQPIEFAARDGLKLRGYVSFPPGRESAKHLPMVVYVHGGPFGIYDTWDFDPMVQAMATRGYAVLQVNFRGSGGLGDKFMAAGYREWGGKMQDDVTDATHWAIAQGIADQQRICIFGASYGGYAALEGAVKEPDLYQCAIGYVGVYDLALMSYRGDVPQSVDGERFLEKTLGNDTSALAQRSPINQLDRLKAKVMLVVGGKDERVPPVQGRNLHSALLKRNIQHEWLYKPNEMHGFYDEANNTELYTKLVQFLAASIGPGVTTTQANSGSSATVH
ncbi:alpha/beta fold hydrolase [Rhodanobacter sp. C03]|uniref:alpha/beta hydrolase family protein n=1 Tax=Rhodanobacter sp. C03 TaxID=1945858 RepID=UPI000987726A|nr:alpha/beta fold hydrolase [Rhodanobacter sp. C03]OOG60435.1 S9 family peptidase [Rhodanobacter sp. C03]